MSEDNFKNPFVLQCKDCNNILTDSFSLQDYKNGYLIHTFSTIKEDKEEDRKDKENNRKDKENNERNGILFKDCSIKSLKCTCNAHVGVFLSSVSSEFNGMASMYAFDKLSVKSYMLGSCVSKEKGLCELIDDVERLKSVVSQIYKRVYQ